MPDARANKNPAEAGFLTESVRLVSGGLQRLDARSQARLVTGGLVLVDQATCGEAVQQRLGSGEGFGGAGGVVGVERLEYLLTAVRSCERWATLRALRTTVCLARFLADLMLATWEILK